MSRAHIAWLLSFMLTVAIFVLGLTQAPNRSVPAKPAQTVGRVGAVEMSGTLSDTPFASTRTSSLWTLRWPVPIDKMESRLAAKSTFPTALNDNHGDTFGEHGNPNEHIYFPESDQLAKLSIPRGEALKADDSSAPVDPAVDRDHAGVDVAIHTEARGTDEHAATDPARRPADIRGLFLTGWAAGERLTETVDYILGHDLNAIVIDIKDVDGRLSFALPGTVAQALGANARKMGSPERVRQLLSELHSAGIYTIGRLVLFQDNFLPHERPEWAMRTDEGELWRDASGGYWLDPARPEVLDYHVDIAVEAARLGFDEIQFDYVRYPSQQVAGYNDGSREERIRTITNFAHSARERIRRHVNIPVSAAIYGIVAVNKHDHRLGQDFNELINVLDSVSPMFYPSHYIAGDFGSADPNADPYRMLFASTAAALARTEESDWLRLRPWIQSFFDYGKDEVEDQIRALKDLGVRSFLVWNPSGRYVSGVDYALMDEGDGRFAHSPFRSSIYPLVSRAVGTFQADRTLKLPTAMRDDSGGPRHVRTTRRGAGYRIELWQGVTDRALPEHVNSPRADHGAGVIGDGGTGHGAQHVAEAAGVKGDDVTRRVIALERSPVVAAEEEYEETYTREEGGIALTWVEDGYEWYLWAPSAADVTAVKQSLRPLPASLFQPERAEPEGSSRSTRGEVAVDAIKSSAGQMKPSAGQMKPSARQLLHYPR